MLERLNEDNPCDVLTDVLETLRFKGSVFFRSDLAAPWGIELPPEGLPRFHIALSGECYVGTNATDTMMVNAQEIVMLANGGAHWIADQPGRELISSQRAGDACELGAPLFQQGDITNMILCGLVHFDQASPHPIFSSLPEIVHFSEMQNVDSVWSTIALIESEIQRTGQHSGPIIDRLTEVLFLRLLDEYSQENSQFAGFIGALRDRRLYRALSLIHGKPEYPWTLAVLGDKVGMSRATLVRHFQDAIGLAPMTYIANWRLMKAYSLVKYTSSKLDEIADSVGFATAQSLSRAFARFYGMTPQELRRNQGSGSEGRSAANG